MTTRFVTVSLTTVGHSPSRGGGIPARPRLAALAMLVIEQTAIGWTFGLRSAAVGAGDSEHRLLAWAADQLPVEGMVVGWGLADRVVTPQLDAAREVDPTIAAPFLDRLIPLVTSPTVDLMLHHGEAAATTFEEVAAGYGIALVAMSPRETETAWTLGDTGRLRRHASEQVLAAWRIWLAGAPRDEFPAKEAFLTWLADDDRTAGSEDGR